MPAEIILQQTPDDAALLDRREQLAAVRTTLAERESSLLKSALSSRRLKAVTFARSAFCMPSSMISKRALRSARSTFMTPILRAGGPRRLAGSAQETHDAAFGEAREAEEFDPPPSLKTLFRDVAKRIHPDFARDDAQQRHFTLLMARANQAYSRGDTETLQRLLDDHREIDAAGEGGAGESAAADFSALRVRYSTRSAISPRWMPSGTRCSPARSLNCAATPKPQHANTATCSPSLPPALREQIADARRRFELIDGQSARMEDSGHGR